MDFVVVKLTPGLQPITWTFIPFTSQDEYQRNPSTALLVICLFVCFLHTWLSFTLAEFILHARNTRMHANTGSFALETRHLPISVPIIHHQALNMQIVLISVLGEGITYSNVPSLFKFTLIYIHINDSMPAFAPLLTQELMQIGGHKVQWLAGLFVIHLWRTYFTVQRKVIEKKTHSTTFNHTDIRSHTLVTCSHSAAHSVVTAVDESGEDSPGTLLLLRLRGCWRRSRGREHRQKLPFSLWWSTCTKEVVGKDCVLQSRHTLHIKKLV